MTKIAETYFRLGIRLNDADQQIFKTYLEREARRNCEGLFHQTPQIAVYLEDGSVRGWIVAAGLLLNGIEHYGSFRSGIDYLVNDARAFSDKMLSSVRKTGVAEDDILRTERRTAVQGKIARVLAEIDDLKAHGRDLSKRQYDDQLDRIRRKALKIFSLVQEEPDRAVILSNLPEKIRRKLPKDLPQPLAADIPVALRPEEIEYLPKPPHQFLLSGNSLSFSSFKLDSPAKQPQKSDPLYRVESLATGFRLTKGH